MRAKVSFIVESSYWDTAEDIKNVIKDLFEFDMDSNLPGNPDFDKITYIKVKNYQINDNRRKSKSL